MFYGLQGGIVLDLRRRQGMWKAFVHNRVKEIQELVSAKHWSHCPGEENPANIPSSGVLPKELEMSLLWKH